MIAKTSRLTLRELQLSDAAFALRLYNEPSFLQHIGDKGVRTIDDAENNLRQGAIASYSQHGYGMWLVENQQGQSIGMCGLIKRDFLTETDLGYAYLPEFVGQGYAYEAATAVLAYAAQHTALRLLHPCLHRREWFCGAPPFWRPSVPALFAGTEPGHWRCRAAFGSPGFLCRKQG